MGWPKVKNEIVNFLKVLPRLALDALTFSVVALTIISIFVLLGDRLTDPLGATKYLLMVLIGAVLLLAFVVRLGMADIAKKINGSAGAVIRFEGGSHISASSDKSILILTDGQFREIGKAKEE